MSVVIHRPGHKPLLSNFTPFEHFRLHGNLSSDAQGWLVEDHQRLRQIEILTRELLDVLPWAQIEFCDHDQIILNQLQDLLR